MQQKASIPNRLIIYIHLHVLHARNQVTLIWVGRNAALALSRYVRNRRKLPQMLRTAHQFTNMFHLIRLHTIGGYDLRLVPALP